jgi:hypothetical protein
MPKLNANQNIIQMNFLKILLAILTAVTTSCKKNDDVNQLKGTIQAQGITTYMYGTHVLTNNGGQTMYALRSSSVKLDNYIGKNVEISGSKVAGYPVDGGPDYLDVSKIK